MNILQISTLSSRGGAARVMYRLHTAFRQLGHRSRIAARSVQTPEADIFALPDLTLPRTPWIRRGMRAMEVRADKWFAVPALHPVPKALPKTQLFRTSDVIHLHNIHGFYFDYRRLEILTAHKPVVWTLHDMWSFTGHCAYAYECERWRSGCGDCPLLKKDKQVWAEPVPSLIDRTRRVWRTKKNAYRRASLTVVTPSRWLQKLAQESIIGMGKPIHYISNGVDLTVFRPVEQTKAREQFGVPHQKRVLLFSAEKTGNYRKGFALLREALRQIPNPDDFVLLVMGEPSDADFPGFRVIPTGYLEDETTQAQIYAAADLLVFPSLADNQPLSVMESLACGTPVVAFNVGGLPEMVHHMETGYLARYRDAEDLQNGIQTLLQNPARLQAMRAECRQWAESEYDLAVQTERYLNLYRQLLAQR